MSICHHIVTIMAMGSTCATLRKMSSGEQTPAPLVHPPVLQCPDVTDSRTHRRCRRSFLGPLAVTPRGVRIGPRQARSAGGMHARNKQQLRFQEANHYAAYPPSPPRTFERGSSLRSIKSGGSILLPPPKSPSRPSSPVPQAG